MRFVSLVSFMLQTLVQAGMAQTRRGLAPELSPEDWIQ